MEDVLANDRQTRTVDLRVRVTPVEKKRAEENARQLGMTVSQYVRLLLTMQATVSVASDNN